MSHPHKNQNGLQKNIEKQLPVGDQIFFQFLECFVYK